MCELQLHKKYIIKILGFNAYLQDLVDQVAPEYLPKDKNALHKKNAGWKCQSAHKFKKCTQKMYVLN